MLMTDIINSLEARINRHDEDIKEMSGKIVENSINMNYIKEIVQDFKLYINENTKTITSVRDQLQFLNKNQESFEKQLCAIKEKVDGNEEAHKVDTRPIWNGIITKLIVAIIICGLGISIFYTLLS